MWYYWNIAISKALRVDIYQSAFSIDGFYSKSISEHLSNNPKIPGATIWLLQCSSLKRKLQHLASPAEDYGDDGDDDGAPAGIEWW